MKSLINKLIAFYRVRKNPINYARRIGVTVGRDCQIAGGSSGMFGTEPQLVLLGNHVEVSGEVIFLTHDGGVWVFRDEDPTIDVFGPIRVGNNVFIGYRSIVLPGTVIGDNCVIGAGSVVRGTLAPNGVYAGVPVRRVREISDYKTRMFERRLPTKHLAPKQKIEFLTKHFSGSDKDILAG